MIFKRFALLAFVLLAASGAGVFARPVSAASDPSAKVRGRSSRLPRKRAAAGARAPRAKFRLAPDLSRYEGRTVASVEVVIEEAAVDDGVREELRALLRVATGRAFSVVLVRESLLELFKSDRVANARVEASDASGARDAENRPPVALRFVIRPQVLVGAVVIAISDAPTDAGISEDELRARLVLLEPGKRLSQQAIANNANVIQVYLRDRGFYRADVEFSQQLDASKTRAAVTYRVTPGERTTVADFTINVEGFDAARVRSDLALQVGAPFTVAALAEDVARVRQALIEGDNLAPRLNEPRTILNPNNTISVELTGGVGPQVAVSFEGYELSERRARELLPVKREGSVDISAIIEGARRLTNRLQEQGYFFADVTATCTVVPPLTPPEAVTVAAGALPPPAQSPGAESGAAADETCELLNPEELSGRNVGIVYRVEPGRRFKLTDIRLEGTEKLAVADIAAELRTKQANALGFIPFFGLGRGFTSAEALERDQRTIELRMRDLGYLNANATVRQGVSPEGESLIITFVVAEGPLTRVASVETRGNQLYTSERLRDAACPSDRLPDEPCNIIGGPYSRTATRAEAERIRNFYSRQGYAEADIDTDIIDLPDKDADKQVRVIYNVKEADKVFINRIFVNGNINTKRDAILNIIPLRPGQILRADQVSESERNLYATDAFRQVIIRTEASGRNSSGFQQRDIIIDVEERQRYVMDYGGGFSTDSGPLGLFEIRNNNLFGELKQGAFRSRGSRRQQLVRFEYFDQRFRRYGKEGKEFAPLTISAQYQRDTSVTRFFRSTIDRGNGGIVQRLNEDGNPVDINCALPLSDCPTVGEPTINRFTINAETQRDFELELGPRGQIRKRSTLFLRYNYEDVRLFNTESLLIAPILRPDRSVRLSRFGASFARDTRDSAFDATRGDFFSADYAIALKALGGNISFSKLLLNYRRYYKLPKSRGTVLAGGLNLGLARLYNPTDRDGDGDVDGIDETLPISERFFSGGSTTLRGFDSEEAGPRIVVRGGEFFNSQGERVIVDPFTVPIGGNAMVVANLEARVAVSRSIQVVPFYDGGNVFRQIGDIFGRAPDPGVDPNLRARWTHTVGLGFRVKTPVGPLSVDYGYLLNPPQFIVSEMGVEPPAIFRVRRGQIHFRFGQTF